MTAPLRVVIERPSNPAKRLRCLATVTTADRVLVFAVIASLDGTGYVVVPTSCRFDGRWRPAFSLPADEFAIYTAAILDEVNAAKSAGAAK